jgi:hypothetical protein
MVSNSEFGTMRVSPKRTARPKTGRRSFLLPERGYRGSVMAPATELPPVCEGRAVGVATG